MLFCFTKRIILALGLLTLLGCATTPKTRFPSVYKEPDKIKEVDLVVNVLVRSDIQGSDIGIDREKQSLLLNVVNARLTSKLEENDIKVNSVHSGFGLLYKKSDKVRMVYSENDKGLEQEFELGVFDPPNSHWATEEGIAFLRKAIKYAPKANDKDQLNPSPAKQKTETSSKKRKKKKKKRSKSAKKPPEPLKPNDYPEFLNDYNRYVLFANASLDEIALEKSVGTAFATAILSAALTGGMYIYSSAPVTGSMVNLILFDNQEKKIIWHHSLQGGDLNAAHKTVDNVIMQFPGCESPLGELNKEDSDNTFDYDY